MADNQPEERAYNSADDVMRQRQRTLREHYVANENAFRGLNPMVFDATFTPLWDARQEAAEAAQPGSVRAGILHEETKAVSTKLDECRAALKRLFYAAGQAFPGNAGRLNQYGKNRYEAARKNPPAMITLLDLALDAASRPADALALATYGWSAADTLSLGTLGLSLTAAATTQQTQKGTGVEEGQSYVGLQNALYRCGQQVSLAAKTLYADDFAKRQLFDLTEGGPAHPAEDHEVTVKPGQQKTVLFTTPLDGVAGLHLLLSVPRAGMRAEVGRIKEPTDTPPHLVPLTREQRSRDVRINELGPVGQLLLVRNVGEHAVRVVLRVLEA